MAAQLLQGKKIHPELRTIILPGTQQIYLEACAEDILRYSSKRGRGPALPPVVPVWGAYGNTGPGEKALATTNRNFVGRMGTESEYTWPPGGSSRQCHQRQDCRSLGGVR